MQKSMSTFRTLFETADTLSEARGDGVPEDSHVKRSMILKRCKERLVTSQGDGSAVTAETHQRTRKTVTDMITALEAELQAVWQRREKHGIPFKDGHFTIGSDSESEVTLGDLPPASGVERAEEPPISDKANTHTRRQM